jgi:hypothetical protein
VEGALKWSRRKIQFGTERWVGFLLEFLVDGASFVVSRIGIRRCFLFGPPGVM